MNSLRGALWTSRLRAGGPALEYYARLRAWAALDARAAQDIQHERLTALLLHAHGHVPYYRPLLEDAGVVRGGRVDLASLASLPALDKRVLRTRFDDLRSRHPGAERAQVETTGGSTGEPVRFLLDADWHQWKIAIKLLFDSWTGYRPGQPFAVLWGAHRDIDESREGLAARLGRWTRNEMVLNAFSMDQAVMHDYLERLDAFRPRLLLAYAQSIFELARFALAEGREVRGIGAIMTSATTLDPHMRRTIEAAFGVKVYNRYGSREVADVACDYGDGNGLVICAPTHYVEVVRPDGSAAAPGETGEILVTPLIGSAMPLLRYRIGDVATMPDAHHASHATLAPAWPRFAEVTGRVTDIFYTARGAKVYGGYFTQLLYSQDWIKQFQVVQEEYRRIRVNVVPTDTDVTQDAVRARLEGFIAGARRVMGDDCVVDTAVVDEIAPGPTGKHRYTISSLGPPS